MGRAERRAAERQARRNPQPRSSALDAMVARAEAMTVQAADLLRLDPAEWREGDPVLARVPAATDGTDDSRIDARKRATEGLLVMIRNADVRLLGEVTLYEWGPADVAEALDALNLAPDDATAFRAWYDDHPAGTLICAAGVTVPPQPNPPPPGPAT